MKITTIQIDSEKLKDFRQLCYGKGLVWRPVFDAMLDKEISRLRVQSKTRSKDTRKPVVSK